MSALQRRLPARHAVLALLLVLSTATCTSRDDARVLTAEMPLHLEDHLDAATFTEVVATNGPKADLPKSVEWRFDQPQPDWKVMLPNPAVKPAPAPAYVERTTDALRVSLLEGSRHADKRLHGGIYVDLPGWRREEWAYIIVRGRTTTLTDMTLGLNPRPGVVPAGAIQATFARSGGTTPIVSDGSLQTYQIRPDWAGGQTGSWMRVGFYFRSSEPSSIDILPVSVVPIAALYAGERAGLRSIAIDRTYRRSVFTHAPGRLAYRVRVPEGGRLQAALGVLNLPVEFRVTVQLDRGEVTTVFQGTHVDPEQWAERTVDLSSFAGPAP